MSPGYDIYGDPVPCVGFDLDMTLVDSRPGIAATLRALADEIGDPALDQPEMLDLLLRSNVDAEFALRYGADGCAHADRFRVIYVDLGVPGTALLPGAINALESVRNHGLGVIVITAKFEPNARRCLDHVGLPMTSVFGWRHGPAKAETLIEQGAIAYVGDTEADMLAAQVAGIPGLGVTTGPHTAEELIAAGAVATVDSLLQFPSWWDAFRPAR